MNISELYELYCQHPVVTTDTRDCPAGSLFFALRGASFNGNDFALKALEAGCAYAVVDDPAVGATNASCTYPTRLRPCSNWQPTIAACWPPPWCR